MRNQRPVFNQINEITVSANFFKSLITATHGNLTLGNMGLEFVEDFDKGFIQIPYKEIREVRVKIAFGFIYQGIIVDTNANQHFNFVTSKTKKVIHVLNRKLKKGQVQAMSGSPLYRIKKKK